MKLKVEFEYDEKELGDFWFNIDNLKLCLFSDEHTTKGLLKVDRKSVVQGKSVDLGGRRIIKKKIRERIDRKRVAQGTSAERVTLRYR